jgi:hypothetical protein
MLQGSIAHNAKIFMGCLLHVEETASMRKDRWARMNFHAHRVDEIQV